MATDASSVATRVDQVATSVDRVAMNADRIATASSWVVTRETNVATAVASVVVDDAKVARMAAFVAPDDASVAMKTTSGATEVASVVQEASKVTPEDAFVASEDDELANSVAHASQDVASLAQHVEKPIGKESPLNQNKSKKRSFVSLHLPEPVPALISYAQGVVASMSNNPHFTAILPSLADVSAAIAALQSAETAALSRLKGTIVVRNDKKTELVTLLQELRNYVQHTADADPENGAAIIQSSGFPLRKTPVRQPRVFAAKPGAVSGSVVVTAVLAARRASYEWQYSTDGGKTWIEAPPSLRAKTTILGLPVAASVQIRYRSVTKAGPSDWAQPLVVVVK